MNRMIDALMDKMRRRLVRGLLMVGVVAVAYPALAQEDKGPSQELKKPAPAAPKQAEKPAEVSLPQRGPGQTQPPPRDALEELLSRIDPAMFDLTGVEIEVEEVSGQIIIRGPQEAVAALKVLIEMLDQSLEQKKRKILEVVTVSQRDANEIARSVQDAYNQARRTPATLAEDEVAITALSTNILLVAALPEDIDFVIDVIRQVDEVKSEIGELELLVFDVEHRKASDVAEELRQFMIDWRKSRGISGVEGELQITPNNANNTIMVIAPESERATIQELLDTIDVEPKAGWSEMKLTLFPLYHSKANDMANVINELLTQDSRAATEEVIRRLIMSKVGKDGTKTELPPINLERKITIIAHEGTNSLIVATAEENVGPMGELIRLMDDVPLASDVDVRVFPLKHAKAEELKSTINEMFDDGKQLVEDPDGSGQDGVPEGEVGKSLVYNIGLSADVRTNTLIASGRAEQLALVARIVEQLDAPIDRKVVRVLTVFRKDASEIAGNVGEAVRDALAGPATKPEDEVSITALSGNILLVSALPKDIDLVESLIRQVDQITSALGDVELFGLQVKHRSAFDVVEQLREIVTDLRERRGLSGEGETQFWPNNANNVITVIAPHSERETIQQLIDQIDVEPVEGHGTIKLAVFPLLHSKANDLVSIIEGLLTSDDSQEATEEVIFRLAISRTDSQEGMTDLTPIDLEKPLRIISDEGSNSLIVATVEENMAAIGELIRMLDDVPTGEEIGIKLFPLHFADAQSVGDILKEMFDQGKQLAEDPDGSGADAVPAGPLGKIVYNVGISADARTNTLIVSGREEQLLLAEMIVVELDRPATALKFPLRIFPLGHADATRIAQIITELFDQRFEAAQATGASQGALERERVFLSVDIRSNSLILSASEENYTEIVKIARQLDAKPAKLFEQIRIIECKRLSAGDLKEKIEELWQRKAELRREEDLLEDLPVIAVDERSNSLIIASSLEDFEEIERLIEALESKPLIDDTRLFRLAYTDAMVLTEMLDELFSGMEADSESFEAPTIIPDQRTNSLIVAATRDTMERVDDLIVRLDVEAGPNTAVFKVYPLTYGSAGRLAPQMEELFDARRQGQDTPSTPIVILPEETSNSLVCSASRDDHQVIADLLTLLDKPSSIARQVEIFPLKLARAQRVAETLDSLFATEGPADRADAMAVEADERTNAVIVWASSSEMENIAEIIRRIDTTAPVKEMMLKMIQLKHALADDFATLLEETLVGAVGGGDEDEAIIMSFVEKLPNGRETVRKLLRQDIRIEPDARTNSLMVMAPSDSMAMLEAMIRDFDQVQPIRSELRLFPLINSDAEAMVEQLTELFDPDIGDGEARAQLFFGADEFDELELPNVGQDLRFAADPRTNTLIAAGAEIDLRMVEEYVLIIDSQEVEDRVVDVYQASYRSAEELAGAMQGFIEQELAVLGEIDDEEAQARRMERQVSIESLGSEEEGSSSLIFGTSRRAYQQTMEMIQALDRPEPQVMLSLLIAEVSHTDSVELGIEIAGQDLNFSDSAVVGPNGIIEGSDFDWVVGTGTGVAGLGPGGFNFTLTGEDLSFILHALQQNSRLEVLSSPVLMIRNGEEGNITIADRVPFLSGAAITTGGTRQPTIDYEDVGIILTATPHISPDGYVTIELEQKISSFSGENLQLAEGLASPIFSERSVNTNVTIRDGETVIVGGLIERRVSDGETKVPILGDLPLIGPLFRTTSISEQTKELLVVLTVDVLRTDEDVRRIVLEQRELFNLPLSVGQSPLMRGLRILPDEGGLGPEDEDKGEKGDTEPAPSPAEDRKLYGPRPKIYGPVITHPTTTTEGPVYGPRIAQGERSGTE